MKREYLEKLLENQLEQSNPVIVFKSSLSKIKSYNFINKLIEAIKIEDLDGFLSILLISTYELQKTNILKFLFKFKFTKTIYNKFKMLDIGNSSIPISYAGIYNYCYYKNKAANYDIIDILDPKSSDPSAPVFHPIFLSFEDAEQKNEFLEILKKMLIKNKGNLLLQKYIKDHLKEPFFIAVVDEDARFNGQSRYLDDLLLLHPSQIYNLSELLQIKFFFCAAHSMNGICVLCNRAVLKYSPNKTSLSQEYNGPSAFFFDLNCPEFIKKSEKKTEDFLLHGEIENAYFFIKHCKFVRTNKILKILLKLFISFDEQLEEVKASESCLYNMDHSLLRKPNEILEFFTNSVELFEPSFENEGLLIAFLKSPAPFIKHFLMIPKILKSDKLIFSCFVVLFGNFIQSKNYYSKLLIKNFISNHKQKFISIIEMILEFYYKTELIGLKNSNNNSSTISLQNLKQTIFDSSNSQVEYLHKKLQLSESFSPCVPSQSFDFNSNGLKYDFFAVESKFAKLADFFSSNPSDFASRHIFHIFNLLHSNKAPFDQAFYDNNIKFVIIQNILSGIGNKEKCTDVDVLIGLLLNNYFSIENIFAPCIQEFLKNNLSQILFKLKKAYISGIFIIKCCIYKIFRFILSYINIPLYFNYIWSYLEYFLYKEDCCCAFYFLEWIQEYYTSPMIAPFLLIPFNNPEDIPVTSNLGLNLDKVLRRYFIHKKGLEISYSLKECTFSDKYNIESSLKSKSLQSSIDIQKIASSRLKLLFREAEPFFQFGDEEFIKEFLILYKNNKIFMHKIHQLYKECNLNTKGLIGSLKIEKSKEKLYKRPPNIPKFILENFLLKIDHEKQDIYSFVIQEFLKNINEPLEPEIESFVNQFRYTKYEFDSSNLIPLQDISIYSISLYDYKEFLQTLFFFFIKKVEPSYFYLRFMILFEIELLEFAAMCVLSLILEGPNRDYFDDLISIINRAIDGQNGVFSPVKNKFSHKTRLFNNTLENFNISKDKFAFSVNKSVISFLLKCNTFFDKEVIDTQSLMKYYMLMKDYYGIIMILDSKSLNNYELDLLQLCYYLIKDYCRVKGITIKFFRDSAVDLILQLCIDRNYTAANQCLKECEMKIIENKENSYRNFIVKSLKEIIEEKETVNKIESLGITMNVENLSYQKNTPLMKQQVLFAHAQKDYELLKNTQNMHRTLDLINERRSISEDPEYLLKLHRLMAEELNDKIFIDSIEIEYIKELRKKRDFNSCIEKIAKMILRNNKAVKYELALVKMLQKNEKEAKDTLIRLLEHEEIDTKLYFKSTLKLCQISPSNSLMSSSIEKLERMYDQMKFLKINKENNDMNLQVFSPHQHLSCFTLKNPSLESQSKSSYEDQCNYKNISEYIEFINRAGEVKNVEDLENQKVLFEYLQKLYFLAAKTFEKTDSILAIEYYYKSFNINYEAIPRFFHLVSDSFKKDFKKIDPFIDCIIKHNLSSLLPYYNQISTRINLESESKMFFYKILKELLSSFPFETYWNSLILVNSKRPYVREHVLDIVESLPLSNKIIFKNIIKAAEQFTLISQSKKTSLTLADFPVIAGMFPMDINIPGKKVKINGIKDSIFVFHSLQTPKKIILIGDDGKEYPFIVKFKDDLRKDGRFMDLSILLNKIFDYGFYIRCYNVIPFTHDSGIIEFIPDLCSIKETCIKYYTDVNEVLQKFIKYKKIGSNNFGKILSLYKPIFRSHFKKIFNDSYVFYKRIDSFTKTYAIMNIVGWFMGLGDRHAENIHYDLNSGDTVHVDLNCIFDKAKTFEVPEKVPFRLTQNIIDSFGILGTEGTYKESLRYTLTLMKENKDVILANLLSFVFDPLFEWAKKKGEPQKIINSMLQKLNFDDENEKINELINEATDHSNLGNMYIGWMAFM